MASRMRRMSHLSRLCDTTSRRRIPHSKRSVGCRARARDDDRRCSHTCYAISTHCTPISYLSSITSLFTHLRGRIRAIRRDKKERKREKEKKNQRRPRSNVKNRKYVCRMCVRVCDKQAYERNAFVSWSTTKIITDDGTRDDINLCCSQRAERRRCHAVWSCARARDSVLGFHEEIRYSEINYSVGSLYDLCFFYNVSLAERTTERSKLFLVDISTRSS